jgi:hypothetical protein
MRDPSNLFGCFRQRLQLCLGFLCCLSASLVGSSKGQEVPAIQSPGAVNLEFSRVFVQVDKSGSIGHPHAIEGRLGKGELHLGQERAGELIFDMTTFAADTAVARKYLSLEGEIDEPTRKKVDESMLGPQILAVQKYPSAKLENATLKPTGRNSSRGLPEFELTGDFTLHQKKLPITAMCDLEMKDGWQHLRGTFKIKQSDYGIKPFSKMFGAIGVKDELVIFGDLWVVPAP